MGSCGLVTPTLPRAGDAPLTFITDAPGRDSGTWKYTYYGI